MRCPYAGEALRGLTEDGLEHHHSVGPKKKKKGKWLEQTIQDTMASMSEDLYDTDDDEAPRVLGIKLPPRAKPQVGASI